MLFLLEQGQEQGQRQKELGPLGHVFVGLWKGVRWLFVRGE